MATTYGWDSMNIGPCEVTFGNVVLGDTKGGATFNYKMSTADTVADRTGTTARQRIITGVDCNVECDLTEMTVAQLKAIIPASEDNDDGLEIYNNVGVDLVASAEKLLLKPIVAGVVSTDQDEWVCLPKASCTATLGVSFKLDEQRVYKVTFTAHPFSFGSHSDLGQALMAVIGGDVESAS
jgi:hypothetical protein